MISSAIRKIEKGLQLKFGDFVLPNDVNICSVNLDRKTFFLALASNAKNKCSYIYMHNK